MKGGALSGGSSTGDSQALRAIARMGLADDAVVQLLGWSDDCDGDFLDALESRVSEVVMADAEDVVDAVLVWWRNDDGDLADALIDAQAMLHAGGTMWLITPRFGREGHITGADVTEAAQVAGLQSTSPFGIGPSWQAVRLTAPKQGRAP